MSLGQHGRYWDASLSSNKLDEKIFDCSFLIDTQGKSQIQCPVFWEAKGCLVQRWWWWKGNEVRLSVWGKDSWWSRGVIYRTRSQAWHRAITAFISNVISGLVLKQWRKGEMKEKMEGWKWVSRKGKENGFLTWGHLGQPRKSPNLDFSDNS